MKANPWKIYYKKVKRKVFPGLPEILTVFKKNNVKRVLDFGCGNGRNTVHLAKKGFQVYAFDISKAAVKDTRRNLAKQRLKANVQVWDMLKPLPHSDGFFDVVIAVRAMYHAKISDIKKIVKEVARITKRNGYLFLYGPTYEQFLKYKKQGQRFEKIGSRTYRDLTGQFKGIIYHYFIKKELQEVFGKFYAVKYIILKGRVFSLLARKK